MGELVSQTYPCADQPALPALLILVDVTGDKAYLDAVKSGVQAAFEGTTRPAPALIACQR